MSKPSTIPVWNTGGVDRNGDPNRVEPSAGKKAIGWERDERPGPEYFNWLLYLIGLWITWLGDDDKVLNLSPFTAVRDSAWSLGTTLYLGNLGYIVSGGGGDVVVPIPLEVGQTIKGVVFARYGDGAADISSVKVHKMTAAGVVSDITASATSVTNPPASWADTAVDVTDTVAADGDVFWLYIGVNAANIRIGSIRVTYKP